MKYNLNWQICLTVCVIITGCKEKNNHIGPWLQAPTATSITIMIGTSKNVKAKLYLGSNAAEMTLAVKDSIGQQLHSFDLTDLLPESKYYYQVRWPGGQTETASFITAPVSDTAAVRVLAYGDSRSDPETHEKIVNLAIREKPQILIHTGDLVADGKQLKQWEPQFFRPAARLIRQTPIFPVLGNHERESGYYYDFFPLHERKQYWSADYGMIHIIGLNSGIATDPLSEQYRWLEADLQANSSKRWIIAVLHHPLFHAHPSRPIYEFRYHWQPLFEKYGVRLVLSGHDHYYLRNYPIGHGGAEMNPVTHITTAGGGAPLYKILPNQFTAVSKRVNHFMILDVSQKKISGKAIGLDGKTIDEFSIFKDVKTADLGKYIDFGIIELEKALFNQIGKLEISELNDSLLQFKGRWSIGKELTFNSKINIDWQEANSWQISYPDTEIVLIRGTDSQYEFEATVPLQSLSPGPIANFIIQSDSGSVTDSAVASPVSQTFMVSLEQALAVNASAAVNSDMNPAAEFIKYFANSSYLPGLVWGLALNFVKAPSDSFLAQLPDLDMSDISYSNLFYFAPFHFVQGDYSHWDDWLDAVRKTPAKNQVALRPLFTKIAADSVMTTSPITSWSTIGPWDNPDGKGLDTVYDPENEINFNRIYQGKDGQEIGWQILSTPSGWIDFLELYTPNTNTVAYAYTVIEARRAGQVLFLLGSDDAPAVWLNGKEVHRLPGGRAAARNQDFIVADLQQGKNEVLLKVDQGTGGWKMILETVDRDQIIVAN